MAHIIVVFDHSPHHLRLFESILSQRGYEVVTYQGELSDTRQFNGIIPSLIILGYVRGFFNEEVVGLQILHADPAFASVPILIATTSIRLPQGAVLPEGMQAVSIIHKPFDASELVTAVSRVLKPSTLEGSLN